ncbi:MAG: hypothetical protein R3Y15_07700 [Rikenellaceae bacterium]
MASLRTIKKDVDFIVNEVVGDCYVSLYFNRSKQAEIVTIMEGAIDLRNDLFQKINNPAEKHNKRLVKKHYIQVRQELANGIDSLFEKLSSVCAAE